MVTKNYGLAGTSNSVQYGKNGGVVYYDIINNSFSVRATNESTHIPMVASSITALDTDVNISSDTGKLSFAGTTVSLQQQGVVKFDGTSAVSIPVGTDEQRPDNAEVGMLRINISGLSPVAEYYDGTTWKAVGKTVTTTGTSPITVTLNDDVLTISLDTVPVSSGGTGLTELMPNQLLYGNGTDAIAQSDKLSFDNTQSTLSVGTAYPVVINGANSSIAATATNSDLVLLPNGSGSVVVTGTGNSVIQTNPGETLTLRARTSNLSLESQVGDTTMILPNNNANKVTIQGPSAQLYSQGLADNDLVNKYYVDNLVGIINGGSFG